MGAQFDSAWVDADTMEEAFKIAHDQACYDHGHAGYSGSLAEKTSVVFIRDIEEHEVAEAEDKAEDVCFADEPPLEGKWGPAGAFRVKDTTRWLIFGWCSS